MPLSKFTRFQFSLRELFLAITAVAALLCLLLQNVRHITPFYGTLLTRDFSLSASIEKICTNRGITGHISGGGGTAGGGGPDEYHISSQYGFRIPKKDRLAVFGDFKNHIQGLLNDSHCRVNAGGSGGNSFYWRYQKNGLHGCVKVDMHDAADSPEYVVISYFAIELKK